MEEARASLEALEALERAVGECVRERNAKGSGNRLARMALDFRTAQFLRDCEAGAAKLAGDEALAGRVEAERERISSEGLSGFYGEKRRFAEYQAKYAEAVTVEDPLDACQRQAAPAPTWSGEERHGRYLDLHRHYNRFVNLPGVDDKLSYLDYLQKSVGALGAVPLKAKAHKAYASYLEELAAYLESFHRRAQALVELDLDRAQRQFAESWERGTLAGWERRALGSKTAEELSAALSPAELSHELMVRGAKAGGKPEQRAERLAVVLAQAGPLREAKEPAARKAFLFDARAVALLEARAQFLAEQLADTLSATASFVTRKQTMTYAELAQEGAEEALREQGIDDDDDALYQDDEEEKTIGDNPHNLPLDFDGKPIPLWLYKLHGLRVEYKCEICGNYSYWGRRAFDKHFQEWRHGNGMRLLGIPNTKHFHDIVRIDEARALYAKLQSNVKAKVFTKDEAEQVEDASGNVYTRKTYDDLRRQGLV